MNILFVSIASPPKTGPESLQVHKVLKELLRRNVGVTLLTEKIDYKSWSTNTPSGDIDKDHLNTVKIKSYLPFIDKFLSFFHLSEIQFPDNKFLFHKKAIRALSNVKYKADIIYSRSYPLSSCIAAYKIKHETNTPWVLHMSDPWTLNPYHSISKLDKKWEEKCFILADLITFTNYNVIELYRSLYPNIAYKFHFFPNLVEKPGDHFQSSKKSDEFIILHSGNLYQKRKPNSFLKGFTLFLDKLSDRQRKNVKCIFVGNLDDKIRNTISSFIYSDNLEIKKQVSFSEARSMQINANVLLSLDAEFINKDKALFFPSKLLDYMVSGNPILAITNLGSPTFKFVNDRYGKAFEFDEIESMANFLFQLYEKNEFEMKPIDTSYFLEENVDRLIKWFEALV